MLSAAIDVRTHLKCLVLSSMIVLSMVEIGEGYSRGMSVIYGLTPWQSINVDADASCEAYWGPATNPQCV